MLLKTLQHLIALDVPTLNELAKPCMFAPSLCSTSCVWSTWPRRSRVRDLCLFPARVALLSSGCSHRLPLVASTLPPWGTQPLSFFYNLHYTHPLSLSINTLSSKLSFQALDEARPSFCALS